eukprot:Lithocolla_globosa_v1_NODE_168_length_5520_cov_7.529003.p2 type:complete len:326 gc:universal NODE_168_length_5520_cov_7.529003:4500-3523(-)
MAPNSCSGGGCVSQYWDNQGVCNRCDALCDECSGSGNMNCDTCATAAYLTGPSACRSCDESCGACDGPLATDCTDCVAGQVLTPDGDGLSGGKICVNGGCNSDLYYAKTDGASCTRCDAECVECDPSCQGCIGAGNANCLACTTSFYANSANDCFPCHPSCMECVGGGTPTDCTVCNDPLFLRSDASCQITCEDGYFANELTRVCEPCHPTCSTCMGPGGDKCIRCITGLQRINDDADGVCECPSGEFKPSEKSTTCTECEGVCNECRYAGYFDSNLPQSICTACPAPYSLFKGRCDCPIEAQQTNECRICDDPLAKICDTAGGI